MSGERNADILRRRLAGWTYSAIAERYDLSPTRVRQIVQKMVEQATSTEEERTAKREAVRQERARIVAQQRAEYQAKLAAEREAFERQRRENSIVIQIGRLAPHWSDLNNFGWWLREHEGMYHLRADGTSAEVEYYPPFRAADRALTQWLDGRANETMTVLRLRKIAEAA